MQREIEKQNPGLNAYLIAAAQQLIAADRMELAFHSST